MTVFSNIPLTEKITHAIEQAPGQILPFVTFMEMALYEPRLGYYAASHRQLGPQGDFVTSPHLCSDFGELIAVQLKDCWQALGCPPSFTVVEMGAGQGLISVDALNFLLKDGLEDPFIQALDWKIIEASEALIRWQKHYLAKKIFPLFQSVKTGFPMEWTTLEALHREPIVGCIFSNELVDAFPIHWLEVQNSTFYELGVVADGNLNPEETTFHLKKAPISSAVSSYLQELSIEAIDLPDGYRCEVNLAAQSWMASVSDALSQGFALTIDYGYDQHQLYSPARSEGTLQCYVHQKCHGDPLINIGHQDITSHVNFSALEHFGANHHLHKLARTHQGLFLMSLGLGDRLVSNNRQSPLTALQETLQRREALHALMNPMGLGGFQVLLQGKGLTESQKKYPYQGFQNSIDSPILGT